MDFNEAKKIMDLNRQFYDLLADDFSVKNQNLWEEFRSLGEYFKDGDKALDLGCGNGRFHDLICQEGKNIQYFGVDSSPRLIEAAKRMYPGGQFVVNDGLELSFADNFFDKILCIGVLHHLPGYGVRREFLRHAFRVLKKDGVLVLTVWSAAFGRRRWSSLIKYTWLKITARSKLDWGDFYEPWGNKGVRYFHNFSMKELRSLLEDVAFQIENIGVLERRSGEKNIVVVARK